MNNVIRRQFGAYPSRPQWTSLVERFFDDFLDSRPIDRGYLPHVDFIETADDYQLEMEIPGVDKKDIEIILKDQILTVTGEKAVTRAKDSSVLEAERRHGKFSRSFYVPRSTEASKVTASSKDGVLQIIIPKAEEKRPKRIDVS